MSTKTAAWIAPMCRTSADHTEVDHHSRISQECACHCHGGGSRWPVVAPPACDGDCLEYGCQPSITTQGNAEVQP